MELRDDIRIAWCGKVVGLFIDMGWDPYWNEGLKPFKFVFNALCGCIVFRKWCFTLY